MVNNKLEPSQMTALEELATYVEMGAIEDDDCARRLKEIGATEDDLCKVMGIG